MFINSVLRKARSLCVVFCLFYLLPAPGQSPPAAKLSFGPVLDSLFRSARYYYGRNPDSMLHFSRVALEYSEKRKYDAGIAEASNLIGGALQSKGLIEESRMHYEKGISVAKAGNHHIILSGIHLNKGLLEESTGNYVTALNDYLESIRLKEKIGDSLGIARCLNNIAQIYSRQGNLEDALKTFFRSLEIKSALRDTSSMATTLNNIGVMYNDLGAYDSALIYFTKAIEFYKVRGRKSDTGVALGNMGLAYDRMNKNDTALSYYNESLRILQEHGETFDMIVLRINAASILIEMGNLNRAEELLLQSLNDALELDSREDIRESYLYLAQLNEKKGRYQQAFEYQKKFQTISDSILNAEKAATLAEMHVKYESEKKDEQNKLLQRENEFSRILLERNRWLNTGLAILVALVAIIAVLATQQIRLRARQQAVELEQKVLRSQMNPHFIFNSLQSIQGFIFESKPLEAGKYLSDFARLMRLILENSKTELITLEKEVETLKYYLLLQKLRFSDKMDYELLIDEEIDTGSYLVPPMLLQPCIENAIEHGIKYKEGKGKVTVSITLKGNYFIFVVEDDGVGRYYRKESTQESTGKHTSLATAISMERIGLFNRKSHMKMRMTITDLHNPTGTRVEFEVPVNTKA